MHDREFFEDLKGVEVIAADFLVAGFDETDTEQHPNRRDGFITGSEVDGTPTQALLRTHEKLLLHSGHSDTSTRLADHKL
ncbi:hypothetical protein ACROYT_G033690 [Oculina patagonica]